MLEQNNMEEGLNWCYYLVAFIDVLGQKEAFREINHLPSNEEEKKRFGKVYEETVLFVGKLRGWFKDYFNTCTKEREAQVKVPESKKEEFDEMRKVILKYKSFSDCIQAFVPLQSDKYHSPCINGIFGVLGACGGMLLLSLSKNKSFRAGIDIGIGTELNTGEVYGPGFFSAYTLESKIAQYPRIVIGDQLINYLMNLSNKVQQSPNQTTENIEYCKDIADICLKMIVKDLDGCSILDYLGNKFRENFKSSSDAEVFKDAFKFVETEYKKRKESKDSKLALRYFLLYNYFKDRAVNWRKDL
ncbi:hypothetical protein KAW50_08450 [candidate division WOR-3 bacterium]|nr:hypothetical protein [candidate division WOR-3 bacterium]